MAGRALTAELRRKRCRLVVSGIRHPVGSGVQRARSRAMATLAERFEPGKSRSIGARERHSLEGISDAVIRSAAAPTHFSFDRGLSIEKR